MTVTALIVGAGKGERLGGGIPKQFRKLAGKAVIRRAVEPFLAHPAVSAVRVVVGPNQEAMAEDVLASLDIGEIIIGGDTRQQSVRNGLGSIITPQVLVHDAARPFCPPDVIERLIDALAGNAGAVPVLPVADTLAQADEFLGDAVERDGVARVQTPQAFHTDILREAQASWTAGPATDEASVVRSAGGRIAAVKGDPVLDKLTTEADWRRAEKVLAARLVSRTGTGFDVHAFAGEGPIALGGIAIPSPRGLLGHSDSDVVLHAITDALLGAAALGDIGEHFPPSDNRWKGASSDIFLGHAARLIWERGGLIDHIDCTVIAEAPKLSPYREVIRARIAEILGLRTAQVSVKATTTERLGFTGRGEGIAAQAVASIRMEL